MWPVIGGRSQARRVERRHLLFLGRLRQVIFQVAATRAHTLKGITRKMERMSVHTTAGQEREANDHSLGTRMKEDLHEIKTLFESIQLP